MPASSTGLLLKTTGLKVTAIKIDPYMNIDAGTMRPTEHGEVFAVRITTFASRSLIVDPGEVYVLNDGGEVDLDLGNYERYLNVTLSRDNNITTGKIYREVIEKEVSYNHYELQLYFSSLRIIAKGRIPRKDSPSLSTQAPYRLKSS